MKILLIEPYYSGSHKQWADGFKNHSRNEIKVLSLKGQFWKWRMHGGAVTIASKFNKMRWVPDIILCTDMMDLTVFISLSRKKIKDIPIATGLQAGHDKENLSLIMNRKCQLQIGSQSLEISYL